MLGGSRVSEAHQANAPGLPSDFLGLVYLPHMFLELARVFGESGSQRFRCPGR